MLTEKIGSAAGLIWSALENGEENVKAVRKSTKLKVDELNMALGWLAREGKISFREEDKDIFIQRAE